MAAMRFRRFQFRLRTLFVLTLIVAVACSWLGRKVEAKRRQQVAVDAISEHGGHVEWDYIIEDPWAKHPYGPGWIRSLLGENFFSEVVSIQCIGEVDLEAFPHVQQVQLESWPVSNAGLEYLKRLPDIKKLRFVDTKISKEARADLEKSMPRCIVECFWTKWPEEDDSPPQPPAAASLPQHIE